MAEATTTVTQAPAAGRNKASAPKSWAAVPG